MEFEPINLTTILVTALGVIGTALAAYFAALLLVKKHAVDQLRAAFNNQLAALRELVDAHEERIVQQKARIDEQAHINDLQAEALKRDRREIEKLQRELERIIFAALTQKAGAAPERTAPRPAPEGTGGTRRNIRQ